MAQKEFCLYPRYSWTSQKSLPFKNIINTTDMAVIKAIRDTTIFTVIKAIKDIMNFLVIKAIIDMREP